MSSRRCFLVRELEHPSALPSMCKCVCVCVCVCVCLGRCLLALKTSHISLYAARWVCVCVCVVCVCVCVCVCGVGEAVEAVSLSSSRLMAPSLSVAPGFSP